MTLYCVRYYKEEDITAYPTGCFFCFAGSAEQAKARYKMCGYVIRDIYNIEQVEA